jgi:hypothetical protein
MRDEEAGPRPLAEAKHSLQRAQLPVAGGGSGAGRLTGCHVLEDRRGGNRAGPPAPEDGAEMR